MTSSPAGRRSFRHGMTSACARDCKKEVSGGQENWRTRIRWRQDVRARQGRNLYRRRGPSRQLPSRGACYRLGVCKACATKSRLLQTVVRGNEDRECVRLADDAQVGTRPSILPWRHLISRRSAGVTLVCESTAERDAVVCSMEDYGPRRTRRRQRRRSRGAVDATPVRATSAACRTRAHGTRLQGAPRRPRVLRPRPASTPLAAGARRVVNGKRRPNPDHGLSSPAKARHEAPAPV